MAEHVITTKSRNRWTAAVLVTAICLAGGAYSVLASTAGAQPRAYAAAASARHSSTTVKKKYDHAMNAVGHEYAKGVGVIYPLLSGVKGSAVRRTTIKHLREGTAYLSATLADLKKIDPPKPVAKLHAQLITEITELRGEMIQATTALRTNALAKFERVQDFAAEAKVNDTIDFIQSDGYKFIGKSTPSAPCADC